MICALMDNAGGESLSPSLIMKQQPPEAKRQEYMHSDYIDSLGNPKFGRICQSSESSPTSPSLKLQ